MSFFSWKRNLSISEKEPTYKVRYLGNVQTAMMKGDGCVDKPAAVIWNNYVRSSNPGLEMKLTVTSCGLKAFTKEQGLTEYRAHRISYCIAHPKYPRVFVWVYRHEGKKMKMELRCHAVFCKTEAKAKALAVHLHDKLSFALKEFMREKTRRQNYRLTLQRTNSLPQSGQVLPKRTQFLSTGQHFKPPISKSNTAPRLGSIVETYETVDESFESVEEEDESTITNGSLDEEEALKHALSDPSLDSPALHEAKMEVICARIIDLEIGNDIDELKQDEDVKFCISNGDSDDESSESGFHEEQTEPDQDQGEVTLNCEGVKDTIEGDMADLDLLDHQVCDNPVGDYVEERTIVTSL
ncbi:protein FAM43A-like [Mizuhopecten yessoensis]|uniref:Protein FAM43A n=1 Tax=Mizuhopecten yessoensis TaxID=6573 RepID=A0A210Q6S7_MIZYE|nr:protein FAM43A-like [Mizuhopecten yessoensis]OWF44442.1 Protein FAM43A [Mizuhopecten yessoensis]